jgi:hypothetical protein
MNEQDLRDCFAMFAMLSKFYRAEDYGTNAEECYKIADAMLQARKPKEEVGITAIKRTRKKND